MDRKNVFKLISLILLIFAVAYVVQNPSLRSQLTVENVQSFVNGYGFWGPIVYILVYTLVTILFLPATVVTLASGFLFGVFGGVVYTVIGATLGASLAFLFSRYIGHDYVSKLLNHRFKRLSSYNEKIKEKGFGVMFFLRLIPLFPFTWVNYAMGLTKISFFGYFFGTLLGIIPGTFVYVNLGANIMDWRSPKFILAVVLLMLLIVLPLLYKKYGKKV